MLYGERITVYSKIHTKHIKLNQITGSDHTTIILSIEALSSQFYYSLINCMKIYLIGAQKI
jgi:hypothetical protein